MLKEMFQKWLQIDVAFTWIDDVAVGVDKALGEIHGVEGDLGDAVCNIEELESKVQNLQDDSIEFHYITNLQDAIKELEDEVVTLKVLMGEEG